MLMRMFCLLTLNIGLVITMASANLSAVPEVKDMAISNTQFTFDLLRQIGQERKGENVFFGPFSITTALAMTCMGARGQTAEVMKQVLKWSSDVPIKGFGSYLPLLKEAAGKKAAGYVLAGAQRIYVDQIYSLDPDFRSVIKNHFASQAIAANFKENSAGETEKINSWVSDETRGKITGLLEKDSLTEDTAMVLVQALYFKGSWQKKFKAVRTRPADFFSPQGKITVNMMDQTEKFNYGMSSELDCAAVELPYASNSSKSDDYDLSMLILLPNARGDVHKLEASLTEAALNKLRSSMHKTKVELRMPRFSTECSFDLSKALSSLGMSQAFGHQADFTGMVAGQDSSLISMSKVIHKAVLEVNEEGSKAAAATGIVMLGVSLDIIPPFIADHPFLLFVIDKRADVVLFSGKINRPTEVSRPKEEL